MQLHPAQKQVVEAPNRFRVLNAGRRFGKTILAVEEIVFTAINLDEGRVAYVAPTYQAARDIAWDELKKRLQGVPKEVNESRLEIVVSNTKGTKSKIFLRSWDNVETLRGQFFDFIVLDEVAQYKNFWEGWQEVLRPCLTDRKGRALFISTPLGFNHFYDLFKTGDTDFRSFHFTTYDNPHIDKEEVDKAKQELTEDRFAQEYLADFRKTEGLVFKEFNRNRHLFKPKEIEKVTEILVGVDFGFTNPAAIMEIKRDYDNHFWITSEWYKTGQTTEQIVQRTQALRPHSVYPDPEAPEKILEMERAGLNIREVNKGKDSIIRGIDIIRELFKQNRLHISEECRNLVQELETYHYPEKKAEQNEPEAPVKDNDHALDAIRYVFLTCNPYPTMFWQRKTEERIRERSKYSAFG